MYVKFIALFVALICLIGCDARSPVVTRKDVVFADYLCKEHEAVLQLSVIVYQGGRREVTAECSDGVISTIVASPIDK